MAASLSIDQNSEIPHAQDYSFLRKEGISLIQSLSGELWTDYNTHDPGITLLEAICYALTDLGYRASFDIKDLLTLEKQSPHNWQKTFYTARQILPCNPLTLLDYRKLIIDTEGVRNAWIEKSDDYEISMYIQKTESEYLLSYDPRKGEDVLRLRGLYNVFVDYEDFIIEDKKSDDVAEVIKKKLQNHRNLCEDFISVAAVDYEYFPIEAQVQVSEGTDIEMVNARIYKVIQDFFSPRINFYTLEQMLEKDCSAEEIFNGPVLKYGFIDTNELEKSERFKDIHLSDIVNLISGLEGIIAIKKFKFGTSPSPFSDFTEWINNVKDKQKAPKLDIKNSSITFDRSGDRHRDDKNKQPDNKRVEAIFNFLQSGDFKSRLKGIGKDLPVPVGEFMNVADYFPFQKSLPVIYGMSEKYIDDTVDEMSVMRAVEELLDEKVGVNLRIVINRLLAEIRYHEPAIKILHELTAKSYNDATWIKEIIDRLLDDKSIFEVLKKIVSEMFSVPETPTAIKDQLYKLYANKSRQPALSYKSRILQDLAIRDVKKSLIQVTSSEDLLKLKEAYKRYQIDSLGKPKKLTLQLRGFLMVFEQIMSDYLSQLAHTRELFSFDTSLNQTYFPELVQGVNDLEALFINSNNYKDAQHKIIETEGSFIKKRNIILDHLMSRFSETMTNYTFFMNQYLGKHAGKELIKDKIAFLSDYIEISSCRGQGFDYTYSGKSWDTDNVVGVKKRICRLLGIHNYNRRTVAPESINIVKGEKLGIIRYVVELTAPDNPEYVMLRSIEYEFESEAREILNYILEQGLDISLYEKEGKRDKWNFQLKRQTPEGKPEDVAYSEDFHNKDVRDLNFKKTLDTLNDYSNDENFHVIEHILLRPRIGPREELRRSAATSNADIVDFLKIRTKPEIATTTDNVVEESPYKFKKAQVADQSNKNRTIWKLSFMKDDTELLVVNEEFIFYRHLTRRIQQIGEFGAEVTNYEIYDVRDGKKFKIMANGRYLAESRRSYHNLDNKDINEEIARLVEFFSYEKGFVIGEADDENISYYTDPYSLQISIFIPSWPKRFRDPAFMHLLEKTIYMETPSHIYPHVYWLDHSQMREFDDAYKLWVEELAGNDIPDTDKFNKMISVFNDLTK
ncbi:MAG: hypothetical protein ABIN89_17795 [Chitinophagaceae bacterium]